AARRSTRTRMAPHRTRPARTRLLRPRRHLHPRRLPGDLEALYDHLELSEAVLLGNSLGGVNAYQFAARHPRKVLKLIIEDIGVDIKEVPTFMLAWAGPVPHPRSPC